MKGVKAFLGNIFSDRGVFSIPHTNAESLMYGLSAFSADVRKINIPKKPQTGNLISFTEYKLRRA